MNFLFVHNNFPAQFGKLAGALAADELNSVAAIGSQTAQSIVGVRLEKYHMPAVRPNRTTHPFARRFDTECRRSEKVLFAATTLAAKGFVPDIVIVHCGWGENLPLKIVFPRARMIVYCEFFYRAEGQDVHFDPEFAKFGADGLVALQCKNASTLISLVDGDMGISPTYWQRSTYPIELQSKIEVAHEGIDTNRNRPNAAAKYVLPTGETVDRDREIITFASRNLEPMRGYHVFMRALPAILEERPNACVLIVGGDGCSYGPSPPQGVHWKSVFLNENSTKLDLSRVHFLNHLSYDDFLSVLQVSSVHVYLTYPFVLSWSLLEAMSSGCAIVASDTPPVREAIDGSNGLLVPFFDTTTLANAIIHLLSFPTTRAVLGKAARATILRRYDEKLCIPRALSLMGIGHRSISKIEPEERELSWEHSAHIRRKVG